MKAMILAAGKGTRLAPLTDSTPKPMLPVKGRPLIEWQVLQLKAAGITEIVINTYHLGEQIIEGLGDGNHLGVQIEYSREQDLLDTGGGIKKALPLLGDAPFAIFNGDIWTDFAFNDLPSDLPEGCPAHITLTLKPGWRASGDFDYNDGRVTARGGAYVYCGIALLTPALIARRPESVFSLRDLYFELIDAGALSAQVFEGSWLDIGTLAQYESVRT